MSNKKNLGGNMIKRQNRFMSLVAITVCTFALIGMAGDFSTPIDGGERTFKLTHSNVKVLLNGNGSYRISIDGARYSRDLPLKHQIELADKVFDPLVDPPRETSYSANKAVGAKNLYIVQCIIQPLEAFQKEITHQGGEICGTLSGNALIVVMDSTTSQTVKNMPFVRWTGAYKAEYKLLSTPATNLSTIAGNSKVKYSIWLAKKTKRKDVVDFIAAIGGEVVKKSKGRRMEANLSDSQKNQVADFAYVLAMETATPIENDMNIVRDLCGADHLESVQGYTGQGVRAEVCDGGLLTTHAEFQANPFLLHGNNDTDDWHGTPVSGHVFGSGAGEANARGLLPDAEQPIFASYHHLNDRYAHTQELVNPTGPYRAVFQTNSWGNTQTTSYSTYSADMDEIIFDLDILILQSQSNTGNRNSRPQAWAKNILSVGGVEHYNTLSRTDDCWCSYASIGPAADGRIKPDLCHVVDYTRAPSDVSNTSYREFGGTSGATPITAGHAGLVFQMWADGVFAGGPGLNRDVFNNRPHATMAKGLMIHSAYQYPFSGTSHDKTRVHQGWGMVDVQNLYQMAEQEGWGFPILIDESAPITPLATHTYTLTVTGATPLRATMVYSDPPGVPGASVHRINDLSLRVTSPGGTVYWGNNGLLSGVWSTSGGSSNTVDTVENVFIQNPAAGTWTIEILADEVVQDGHVETPALDADYALIVSGGETTPVTPPAAPTALSANAGACDQIDLSWTDNSDNESSFLIERSTDGSNFSSLGSVGSNTTSYSDTTVAENTSYWYRVKATNSGGDSGYTNTANATAPVCPANPPAAPSGLQAKSKGKSKISLSWNDNSNNESGFRIYRGLSSGNLSLLATVSANTGAYDDVTVSSKTTYYYKVCAYNGDGEACSSEASARTK